MALGAPVSDSKADEGVSYADLPHPLKEGTVVRCEMSTWDAHITGKLYPVNHNNTIIDEDGDETPTWWDNPSTALFSVVKTKFKVGDKVRAHMRAPYGITTNGWTGTVASVEGEMFTAAGYSYLNPEHFDLVEEPKTPAVDIEETTAIVFDEWFDPAPRDPSDFTWSELTDEEKAALLLADHEGKTIQFWNGHMWETVVPAWAGMARYRVYTTEMEEADRKAKVASEISDLRSKIADLEATIH